MIYAIIIVAIAVGAGIYITKRERAKKARGGAGGASIKPPGNSEAQ